MAQAAAMVASSMDPAAQQILAQQAGETAKALVTTKIREGEETTLTSLGKTAADIAVAPLEIMGNVTSDIIGLFKKNPKPEKSVYATDPNTGRMYKVSGGGMPYGSNENKLQTVLYIIIIIMFTLIIAYSLSFSQTVLNGILYFGGILLVSIFLCGYISG